MTPGDQRVERAAAGTRPCPRWSGRLVLLGVGRRAHERSCCRRRAAMPHLIGGRAQNRPVGERTSVVVVGAGIGGLAAAMALSRAGCDVTVVERDDTPDARRRRGRLRVGPARRAAGAPHPRLPRPDPRDPPRPLPRRARGAARRRRERGEHHAADRAARRAELRARRRRPPGAELPAHDARVGAAALRAGRAERALRGRRARRRAARRRRGAAPLDVRGVRLDDGRELPADVVVASTGRRDARARLVRRARRDRSPRRSTPPARSTCRRFYRAAAGTDAPMGYQGGRRAGLGFVVAGADNGTYSATLAVAADDAELRSPPHGPGPLRGGAPAVPRDGAGRHPRRRADHRRCRRWAG